MGKWNKHDDAIGAAKLPDGVNEADFIGAEKELSYLMPKSAFVSANMAYETAFLLAYNDYCFVLRKRALTPDVPYGSTFEAWTQYTIINTGTSSCKMICSVGAEFPNGPPMISRQIKSGMRAGVGELFVKTGETIEKYANSFPK
jgi:VAD1 Analog of StAR-related lipid transfer domain